MTTRLALLAAALALACCSAPAPPPAAGPAPAPAPTPRPAAAPPSSHLTPDQLAAAPFPPPPAAGSAADQADAAAVLAWKDKRTDADCARANRTFFVSFGALWGQRSPFPEPLPAEVQRLFDRVDSEIGTAVRVAKERYGRPRPDLLPPCPSPRHGKKGGGYSYPSTHAAISRVFANVLGDLVPERRAEFIARADAIAHDRLVIGVHYPTDLAAGKAFGDVFHANLLRDEAYRRDLARMRALLAK